MKFSERLARDEEKALKRKRLKVKKRLRRKDLSTFDSDSETSVDSPLPSKRQKRTQLFRRVEEAPTIEKTLTPLRANNKISFAKRPSFGSESGEDNLYNSLPDEETQTLPDVSFINGHSSDHSTPTGLQSFQGMAAAIAKILSQSTATTHSSSATVIMPNLRHKFSEELKAIKKAASEKRTAKLNHQQMGRVVPDPSDREFEKSLNKIATQGVVQLFNAVRKERRSTCRKLGRKGRSRDSVLRKEWNAEQLKKTSQGRTLFGQKSAPVRDSSDDSEKAEESVREGWSVLKEDYMTMSRKTAMKDWDKLDEIGDDLND